MTRHQHNQLRRSFEQRLRRQGISTSLDPSDNNNNGKYIFDQLQGLPFWIWDTADHIAKYNEKKGFCCWNHAIGLPQKNGQPMPLFDYEKILLDSLESSKYLWIKKATGLGITTLFLRWMAYLCTCNNEHVGHEMAIVVGPNIDLAVGLISRIKALFLSHGNIILDSKQTEVLLNGCLIKAYPSNHLDAMRSRMDLKVIFSDESDFYEPGERAILRDVIERYIAKSNPHIILCSTPAGPDGLFAKMEAEEYSIYQRFKMDYRAGLGKIYSHEEIELARQSPSFAREYECQYLGLVGNVFKPEDIQAAIILGRTTYDPQIINGRTPKVIAVDPAWGGSSAFGLVVTEQVSHSRINVLLAEEYSNRPSHEEMVHKVLNIYRRYGNVKKIYCDSAASAFITSLKEQMGERTDWPEQIKQIKSKYGTRVRADYYKEFMTVVPVVFASEHRELLSRTKMLLEYSEVVAIHPQFNKLIAALTTAQEQEGKLLKHLTSHNDVLDAFRMACKHYDSIHSAEESQRIAATRKQQIGTGFVFSAVGTSRAQQQPSAAEMQSRRKTNGDIWQQAFNSDIRL